MLFRSVDGELESAARISALLVTDFEPGTVSIELNLLSGANVGAFQIE